MRGRSGHSRKERSKCADEDILAVSGPRTFLCLLKFDGKPITPGARTQV